jgi:hypothetical protein
MHTYQSLVLTDASGHEVWAASNVLGGFMGVSFLARPAAGATTRVEVPLPVWGLFIDFTIAQDGRRVALVKAHEGHATLLVIEDGTIVTLPGTLGNWAHAFGPGDTVYLQEDAAGVVKVYGFDGLAVMTTAPDPADPNLTVQRPLTYPMAVDTGSGIHHVEPNGLPVQGFSLRAERIVSGVALTFGEQQGDWAAGQATVGLLGGVVAVNTRTGARFMWPHYTPHRARLTLAANGDPRVSISADGAPDPSSPPWLAPWEPYDFWPPVRVAGTRRPVWCVTSRPGHLKWSDDGSGQPFIEGGHWALDAFLAGRPAAVLFHDLRTPLEEPLRSTVRVENLTAANTDVQVLARFAGHRALKVERLSDEVASVWFDDKARAARAAAVVSTASSPCHLEMTGLSMYDLAKQSGAILVCYHDANGARLVRDDGTVVTPDTPEAQGARYVDVELVQRLNTEGIRAIIGHQGYLVTESRGAGVVRFNPHDAMWRIVEWGLKIYRSAGIQAMLLTPQWTGNPMSDGQDAYDPHDVAVLHHFTTGLVDGDDTVFLVSPFGGDRPNGIAKYPHFGRQWDARVAMTPEPAEPLPTPRPYVPPIAPPVEPPLVVVEPPPVTPEPKKPSKGHGGSSAKPMTKKQKQAAGAAAAGGGLLVLLGKIFGWF